MVALSERAVVFSPGGGTVTPVRTPHTRASLPSTRLPLLFTAMISTNTASRMTDFFCCCVSGGASVLDWRVAMYTLPFSGMLRSVP